MRSSFTCWKKRQKFHTIWVLEFLDIFRWFSYFIWNLMMWFVPRKNNFALHQTDCKKNMISYLNIFGPLWVFLYILKSILNIFGSIFNFFESNLDIVGSIWTFLVYFRKSESLLELFSVHIQKTARAQERFCLKKQFKIGLKWSQIIKKCRKITRKITIAQDRLQKKKVDAAVCVWLMPAQQVNTDA